MGTRVLDYNLIAFIHIHIAAITITMTHDLLPSLASSLSRKRN